jgi:hypothetical protein
MEIVATIKVGDLPRLTSIAAALRAAGLENANILEGLGVITGQIADAYTLDALRRVDGVESVEPGRTDVRIPDPRSPIQ